MISFSFINTHRMFFPIIHTPYHTLLKRSISQSTRHPSSFSFHYPYTIPHLVKKKKHTKKYILVYPTPIVVFCERSSTENVPASARRSAGLLTCAAGQRRCWVGTRDALDWGGLEAGTMMLKAVILIAGPQKGERKWLLGWLVDKIHLLPITV